MAPIPISTRVSKTQQAAPSRAQFLSQPPRTLPSRPATPTASNSSSTVLPQPAPRPHWPPLRKSSRTPNQYPRQEHQYPAHHHLKCCLQKRRVHVLVSHKTDRSQFHQHHNNRHRHRQPEILDQKGKRVPDSSRRRHQSRRRSTNPRRSSPR